MTTHWAVPQDWKDQTAFIVGGGTSVLQEDLTTLRGRKVIAVNSSYEAVPFADYLFFGDSRWWNDHRARLRSFAGRVVTASRAAHGPNLFKLNRIVPPPGLTDDPRAVVSNRTSLQGAMNLAFHLGVRRIVLIGADMQRAPDGRTHYHTPHRWQNKPGNRTWDIQMEQLALIVEPLRVHRIKVINTSQFSRIDWWPKMKLRDTLLLNELQAA